MQLRDLVLFRVFLLFLIIFPRVGTSGGPSIERDGDRTKVTIVIWKEGQ
jgi:hypothetical protein